MKNSYLSTIQMQLSYDFKATHRIYFDDIHFKDLKNHLYTFHLTLQSPVNEYGLGIDFFEVDRTYNEKIKPFLNGQLNIPYNSTAENIALFIIEAFSNHLNDCEILSVHLFESPAHSVIIDQKIYQDIIETHSKKV